MPPPSPAVRRAPAVTVATVIAILAALLLRNRGPEPQPATAPPASFSAARAIAFHRAVLPPVPRPIGSQAHDEVLRRLEAQFRALGCETSIERTFACNPTASCAAVANLIAEVPGGASGDRLLLAAHYDSAAAGPGATDDGVGIATMLEVARAIRGERFRNRVTFRITDAEEEGLIGAEGFVADPVASRGAAAVINVESRGTSGPSYLFETSRHNRWLVGVIAAALPRPATSSFFFSVYEMLPNDTDVTVFKRAGYTAINFANIGNVGQYHTRLDDAAHLSPRLLQHDGEHVLAMTRALGNSELRQMTDDNAVWFDILQSFIVSWPQGWSLPLSLLMLLIVIVAAAVRVRDGQVTASMITTGVASFFFSLFAAFLTGLLAMWISGLRSLGAMWVAQPGPSIAAMWLIGIGTAIVVARLLYPFAGFDGIFLGHALCWCIVAFSLSMVLPGASYLALVPATALAVCAIVRAAREADEGWLVIVCGAVAALLHFPIALTLYDALGQPALPIIAANLALVATTFTPLIAAAEIRSALLSAIFAGAVACVGMALFLPPYTADAPRALSLRYVEESGGAHWDADALTPALHDAAPFDLKPVTSYPWLRQRSRAWRTPAPALNLPPVELTVIADARGAKRQLSLLLRSPRGSQRMQLAIRSTSFESMRINGVAPAPRPARFWDPFAAGWHRVGVHGTSEARIDLVLRDNQPVELIAIDATSGLPPAGAALVSARDRSNAVPWSDGDETMTVRKVSL